MLNGNMVSCLNITGGNKIIMNPLFVLNSSNSIDDCTYFKFYIKFIDNYTELFIKRF